MKDNDMNEIMIAKNKEINLYILDTLEKYEVKELLEVMEMNRKTQLT
jgi:hypothetical protein